MIFNINHTNWVIKEVSDEEITDMVNKEGYYVHGFTVYSENTIYINETTPEIERTLRHELMHTWLYVYGHNQDDKKFSNEDICEIFASAFVEISKIIDEYRKQKVVD